ncbi:hypothetical protein [Hymenobacter jeollabukensis]|uniref:Uncharacterized protein n=1 Tax=Hymenobacter jeollabukensis TaxID=2025313 RepID=A0A5R8WKY8_9BACT|nr:hypothetical protein [Hymenobacter jeollabukensis]TLM89416.1 hypothetical protein FDY95_20295 [Hymenobacter jeollabukensis]
MKLFVTLILVLTTAVAAQAKCYGVNLEFWPKSGSIRPNAVFLIEGFEASQPVVSGLRTTHQAYLQADGQRIPLDVQEILVGQFQLTQALLRPRRRLVVGTQYELIVVERARPAESIIWRHKGSRTFQVKYTVEAGPDRAAPAWLAPPTEQAKHYEEYGCGPAVSVEFAAAAQDESVCLVRATVRDEATGQRTTCYLRPAAAGRIAVGHDMCSGAFELEKGRHFTVTFGLLDASGNTTPWTGKAIAFDRPDIPGM